MSESRSGIRAALFLLVLFEVLVIALGILTQAPPVSSVLHFDDPGGAPLVVFRSAAADEPRAMVVRLDESSRAVVSATVDAAADAGARVAGDAFLFGETGFTRLPELDPATPESSRLDGRRFVNAPFPGRVLAAGSIDTAALIAGEDALGQPWIARFDGVESRTLAVPSGLPTPISAVVRAEDATGVATVVFRAGHELFLVRVSEDAATISARRDIPAGLGRVADLGPFLALLAEDGTRRTGIAVAFDPRTGTLGAPSRFASFDRKAELIGTLPGASGPAVLVEGPRGLEAFAVVDGEIEPAPLPPALAAWTVARPRFERSFFLHLAVMLAAWIFGRRFRRPVAKALSGTIAPAPLFRRGLAVVVDLAIATAVMLPLRFSVLSVAEVEYWVRHVIESQSGDLVALVSDSWALFAIVFTGYVAIAEAAFGRTAGKWLFDLGVLEIDGSAASLGACAARGLFHLLDTLQPLTWPMTIILLLWRRQRLGDFWGHTIVVRQLR